MIRYNSGTLGISHCSFLFLPYNIRYTLEGNFSPKGRRINVIECTIMNVAETYGREGRRFARRRRSLAAQLRPGDFNLTADGRLLVVKSQPSNPLSAVYGDLFVEIGPGPLHFTGEIEIRS